MPSAKEVRARQHRQKERVAAQLAERRRAQRRRRQVGGITGVIALVVLVAAGLALGGNNSNNSKVAVAPTSTPPITSAKGPKSCVGLRDILPKGSPPMPLSPGPLPTKLATKDLKVGTGAVVPKNAKVTVNYVGVACSTGKIFDSSYRSGKPFQADLSGGVIQGWIQGIPGMRIGGIRLLAIPPDLAYGATGSGPIGPNEPLFFLVAADKLG